MDQNQDDALGLHRLLLILRRRWRIMALCLVFVLAVTGVRTFTSEKLYLPQVTVEISPEASLVGSPGDEMGYFVSRYMWEHYYRTQKDLITSPSVLNRTVKKLPDPLRSQFAGPDPGRALAGGVRVETLRTSFILKIGYVDSNPERGTQIVNTLANAYMEELNERRRKLREDAADLLSKETLPQLRERVDKANQALADFVESTGHFDFKVHHASVVEAWSGIQARLNALRLQRVNLKASSDSLKPYLSNGVSGVFHRDLADTPTLSNLAGARARLMEELAVKSRILQKEHPKMKELQSQITAVEAEMRESIRGRLAAVMTELDAVEYEEIQLREERRKVEIEMDEAGKKLNQFKRLEQELASAKSLYASTLMREGQQAMSTTGSELTSVRILDFARVPGGPWKPDVTRNMMLGGMAGLLIGAALMFLLDRLDDRILSPEEVEAFLGMDVLAAVPRLPQSKDHPVLVGEKTSGSAFEAIRTLRTEIVTRIEKLDNAKVLAVLSPVQGDGKTTVAASLARAMAMEGRKVLILDADLRRPRVASVFGREEAPGFEKVLSGELSLSEAVRPSKIPGVDVVGAPKGIESAAELASSPRYAEAIRDARQRYDMTIIDTPPVIQVAEGALVARHADAAMLVVREGHSRRGAVAAARKRLASAEVKLLGIVLNFHTARRAGYGYGYAYGYGYKDK